MSTTTYTSTNSRRCMSCGQTSMVGCLRTCPDRSGVVTWAPSSTLADAYVLSGPIPLPEAYQPVVDTLAGGLSWTGVMDALSEGPESHAESSTYVRRVPVGYVVLVFAGLALVGLALVALWLRPLIHAWISA